MPWNAGVSDPTEPETTDTDDETTDEVHEVPFEDMLGALLRVDPTGLSGKHRHDGEAE